MDYFLWDLGVHFSRMFFPGFLRAGVCCSASYDDLYLPVIFWWSVLYCGAGCCRAWQRVAVSCRELECIIRRLMPACCILVQCVAVCCSVLQCVAVCCRVLRWVVEHHTTMPACLLHFDAVRCNVLQCAAVCCSVLQCVAVCCSVLQCVAVCCSMLQCVAVCCSVLQCVAVNCSVLQWVAMCCIAKYDDAYLSVGCVFKFLSMPQHTDSAPHCTTLSNTATHCYALQHTANSLHHPAPHSESVLSAKMAANIDFCRGWDPRPCASVNHRQTWWGPHQRGWSDDARASLQRRPRHELAWIWTDFLANRSVNGPAGRPARRRGRRAGGNDSLHDVRARLKISSQ